MHAVVALEFRALMRRHRILDGQLVKMERLRHRAELVLRRLVEPDPRHRLAGPTGGEKLIEGRDVRHSLPVPVHGAVDDHGAARDVPRSSGALGSFMVEESVDRRCVGRGNGVVTKATRPQRIFAATTRGSGRLRAE